MRICYDNLSWRPWIWLGLFFTTFFVHAEETAESADLGPISVKNATKVTLAPVSETGYFDEQNRYVVDLLEQDYAYLAVRLEDKDGRPVQGATLDFSIDGKSQLLTPTELSQNAVTDTFGVIEFAVVGGPMGLDTVNVTFGNARTEFMINVISLRSVGFPVPPSIEGGIPWGELMKAKVQYKETMLVAEFPENIKKRAGETVKVSGFMLPLEPELEQTRFLLTSNPPSCFFHVPGGPAGAIEVFSAEGIKTTWDPVVLEGRFEPQSTSEIGVVYRLRDARLVPQ